jgi:hypothetical protein
MCDVRTREEVNIYGRTVCLSCDSYKERPSVSILTKNRELYTWLLTLKP